MKKVLSKDILNELTNELDNTPLATSEQIQEMYKHMPGLAKVNVPRYKISRDVDLVHYPFTNSKLNTLLEGITGMKAENLLSICKILFGFILAFDLTFFTTPFGIIFKFSIA